MLNLIIGSLMTEEISDEAAFHLVNCFRQLTEALEKHYYYQSERYFNENRPPVICSCPSSCHNDKSNDKSSEDF